MNDIVLCIIFVVIGAVIGFFAEIIFKPKRKYDGFLIIKDLPENVIRWNFDMHMDPEEIKNKKEIRLKVYKMTDGDV